MIRTEGKRCSPGGNNKESQQPTKALFLHGGIPAFLIWQFLVNVHNWTFNPTCLLGQNCPLLQNEKEGKVRHVEQGSSTCLKHSLSAQALPGHYRFCVASITVVPGIRSEAPYWLRLVRGPVRSTKFGHEPVVIASHPAPRIASPLSWSGCSDIFIWIICNTLRKHVCISINIAQIGQVARTDPKNNFQDHCLEDCCLIQTER